MPCRNRSRDLQSPEQKFFDIPYDNRGESRLIPFAFVRGKAYVNPMRQGSSPCRSRAPRGRAD